MRKILTILVLVAAVPFIAGCPASRPADMVETAPCTITVQRNGSPESGVSVTLFLEGGNPLLVACGKTDSSGNAAIKTSLGDYTTDGAPIGTCKVTLDKPFEMPPDRLTPDQVSDLSSAEAEKYVQECKEAVNKSRIIPETIANVGSTPLKVEVAAGTGGTLTVELNDHKK